MNKKRIQITLQQDTVEVLDNLSTQWEISRTQLIEFMLNETLNRWVEESGTCQKSCGCGGCHDCDGGNC